MRSRLGSHDNQTRAANRPRYQLKDQTMKQFFIDLFHAALFALCIGAPFAGFFYFYGA
jgi:hypothetical protein